MGTPQITFEDLTEQELLFLELLFDEDLNPWCDPEVARDGAGYPKTVSAKQLMRKLKPLMQEDTQSYLLTKAPLAAKILTDVLKSDNPSPSVDKLISAATQVLDRAGITKKDKQEVEVKVPDGILILPALNSQP
jgi:hypothetical protein